MFQTGFSPRCRFCFELIDWGEFTKQDRTTKRIPLVPGTIHSHIAVCKKQLFLQTKVLWRNPEFKGVGNPEQEIKSIYKQVAVISDELSIIRNISEKAFEKIVLLKRQMQAEHLGIGAAPRIVEEEIVPLLTTSNVKEHGDPRVTPPEPPSDFQHDPGEIITVGRNGDSDGQASVEAAPPKPTQDFRSPVDFSGEMIYKARREKGFNASKFGVIVGVHGSQIGNLESGKAKPSLKLLRRIDAILNLKIKANVDGKTIRKMRLGMGPHSELEQFAKLCGVSKSTVMKAELGTDMNWATLRKLAGAFRKDITDLLCYRDPNTQVNATS